MTYLLSFYRFCFSQPWWVYAALFLAPWVSFGMVLLWTL